jgi:hypothetical protein
MSTLHKRGNRNDGSLAIYRPTDYGFSIYRWGRQVGAGVGRSIEDELGRGLTEFEAKYLRRCGIIVLPGRDWR